jgi:hypothetical protein
VKSRSGGTTGSCCWRIAATWLALAPLLVVSMPLQVDAQGTDPRISKSPIAEDYRTVFRLKETHRFGRIEPADDPEAWAIITDLAPGPRDGVIFVDSRSQYAGLITPSGGVVAKYSFGEGSGPGEFRGMDSAIWDGSERVYVTDRINTRIQVFSVSGEYLGNIPTGTIASKIIVGAGDSLWIRPWMNTALDLLRLIRTDGGAVIGTMGGLYAQQSWGELLRADPALARSAGGFMVLAPYPYVIHEYSLEGTLLRRFGRSAEWLTSPEMLDTGQFGEVATLTGGSTLDIACLANGMTVVLLVRRVLTGRNERGLPQFQSTQLLDFFDSLGRWLATVPVAELTGHDDSSVYNLVGASDGALWVSERMGYDYIVRFELESLFRNVPSDASSSMR